MEAKYITNAIDYGSGIPFENWLEYDVASAAPRKENQPAAAFVAALLELVPSIAMPTNAKRKSKK